MTSEEPAIVSSELLELLVCPLDHAKLAVHSGRLNCVACGRTFDVHDGVPDMIVDDHRVE